MFLRLKLSTLFIFISYFSVFLFICTIITLLTEPSDVLDKVPEEAIVVDQPAKPDVTIIPTIPPHCLNVIEKIKQKKLIQAVAKPPWIDLILERTTNATNQTTAALVPAKYVNVFAAQTRRLGNQLFNYASLFGIAWRNRRIPLWPDGKTQLRSVFNLRIPIDVKHAVIKNPDTHFMKLREPGWAIYGPKTEQLPDRNISLTVFLQSWKYFLHVEDQLRHDFTFHDNVIEKARRFINSTVPAAWRDLDFVRVAIHVRRGDHISKGLQHFGWSLHEPDYFNRSMDYFRACLPRVQFVVLSNDIKWCRRNIVGENIIYSAGHNPTDDMAIASLCDHAVLTIGSYGWWVAWFANGVTVTQKNFPKPKSQLLRRLKRADYYKTDWIAL